jgi:hypothetical protein
MNDNELTKTVENLGLAFDLAKIQNLDELFYQKEASWAEKGSMLKILRLQINSK